MGGYAAIPLSGTPAPRINPYQAAAQGEAHGLQVQDDLQARQLHEQQIESAKLQVAAQQQAQRDQQNLQRAFMDSAGNPDKFLELGAQYGASPAAVMKAQAQRAAVVKNLAQSDAATLLADQRKHDEARGQVMAYEELPETKRAASWQNFLQSIRPHLKPEEFASFAQQYPTYPGSDVMKPFGHGLAFGGQLVKEALAERGVVAKEDAAATAGRRAETAQQVADTAANVAAPKIEQGQRANAAQALELAAHRGEDDYMEAYHALPAQFQKEVPTPQEFDEAKTPGLIRTWGSTMGERNRATEADARIEETGRHNQAIEASKKIAEAQGWARIDRNKPDAKGQTRNSIALDMRKASTQFDAAVKQEGVLNDTRRRLGHALEPGSMTFIDKYGKLTTGTTPITTAQRQDMQDRLDGATEQYDRLLDQKYDAGEKMGMQPKVSKEDAKKALREPATATSATGKAAPANRPAATAKPALNRAEMIKKAKAAGRDPDAFLKSLEQHYELK